MAIDIVRGKLIAALGGTAVWQFVVRAQQPGRPGDWRTRRRLRRVKDALTHGMKESGFIEGQNVQVVYRWAQEAYDRLPGMADELVNLRIAVLAPPVV